jgi:hypothetical protein
MRRSKRFLYHVVVGKLFSERYTDATGAYTTTPFVRRHASLITGDSKIATLQVERCAAETDSSAIAALVKCRTDYGTLQTISLQSLRW